MTGSRVFRSLAMLSGLALFALPGCQSIAPRRAEGPATSTVYVVRRAWHIDIGFAAPDLQPPLRSLLQAFPPASYLEFGFGDRHYLLTRDHGTATLLGAIWPGDGLILMTALKASPQQAFGTANVTALALTRSQALAIQTFVWRSLRGFVPVADGPYAGSVFYAAVPRYSGLHTCNTWAAESLHSADLPVHSSGVLFADQLWSQVRHLAVEAPDPLRISTTAQ